MSPNLRGALFMCIAMACFTINDSFVKWATDSLTLGQIILIRGIMASTMLVVYFRKSLSLEQLRYLWHPAVFARLVGECGATLFFLMALLQLPIAFVTAIIQALPLAVTFGAAMFFSEPVGWRRWTAIIIGFVGILIIVRPGLEGFSFWSLAALVSVGFSTLRDLSTRVIPKELNTSTLSTASAIIVMIVGGLIIQPFGGWNPVDGKSLLLVFSASVALIIAYHSLISAMRNGDISFISPFRYVGLLWAVALGFIIFGDVPDRYMLVGAAIVIASGLYSLYRERVVNRVRPIAGSTSPGMAPDGF